MAINERCDDCQDARSLCDRFCPSGALHREEGETDITFVFEPQLCADCGQCEFVCPQDAITRAGEAPGREATTLMTFTKAACEKCGAVAHLVDGLCPACSRDASVQRVFMDWFHQSA